MFNIFKGKLSTGEYTNDFVRFISKGIISNVDNDYRLYLEKTTGNFIFNPYIFHEQLIEVPISIYDLKKYVSENKLSVTFIKIDNLVKENLDSRYKKFVANFYIEYYFNKCEIIKTGCYKSKKSNRYHQVIVFKNKYDYIEFNDKMLKILDNIYFDFLLNYLSNNNISFILYNALGRIKSNHITTDKDLFKKGFKYKASDWTYDLGDGVYTFLNTNTGLKNVLTYFSSQLEYDKQYYLLETEYVGKYSVCVFGLGHIDYVVLMDANRITNKKIKKINIADMYINLMYS